MCKFKNNQLNKKIFVIWQKFTFLFENKSYHAPFAFDYKSIIVALIRDPFLRIFDSQLPFIHNCQAAFKSNWKITWQLCKILHTYRT